METHKITDLKQGVRNPDRVNVYVDGKFSFSLDISQVVDFGIKVGLEVSDVDIAEFKKASEFGKLYQRTLEWVLVRPRSIREVNDYLRRKLVMSSSGRSSRPSSRGSSLSPRSNCGFPSEDINELSSAIISKLQSKGYVDDLRFAEYYAENRFSKKGISLKRLKMELIKKGVSKDIIEEVLADSDRNDREELEKMIAKKRAKYDDEKLIQYLCRQGFPYDLVRESVRSCGTDLQN